VPTSRPAASVRDCDDLVQVPRQRLSRESLGRGRARMKRAPRGTLREAWRLGGMSTRVNVWSTDPTALIGSRTGVHPYGTRSIAGISGLGCTQRYSARRPLNPMVVGSSATRPISRTACVTDSRERCGAIHRRTGTRPRSRPRPISSQVLSGSSAASAEIWAATLRSAAVARVSGSVDHSRRPANVLFGFMASAPSALRPMGHHGESSPSRPRVPTPRVPRIRHHLRNHLASTQRPITIACGAWQGGVPCENCPRLSLIRP
jgi:hypothetical protein